MLEFRLLGPIEAHAGNRQIALGGAKPRALLAALLLEHGHVVPTGRLVDVVWGDAPPETARALIQTYVSNLRQAFAAHGFTDVINTQSPGYVIRVGQQALDRDVFLRLLSDARAQAKSGDRHESAELLSRALGLWHGPALAGLEESRLEGETRKLEELRIAAAEERVAAELALGRMNHLAELTALVSGHPTNERLRGQLMVTLFLLGRQADALSCYRQGRDILIGELGVEPGAELNSLHSAILRGQISELLPWEPEHGPNLPRQTDIPAQLPPAPADFSGRRAEVAALAKGLEAAGLHVVAGPGGTGKSTLATRVAHQVAESFPDGQLHAELRGMSDTPSDPAVVLGRFLRVLGVHTNQLPESIEERCELYRTMLAKRRVLVILDDACSEQQVRPLIPAGVGCAVLITSRDRLAGLAGAARIELGMMPTDEAEDLLEQLVGAPRVREDTEAVRGILSACGNLPLAIRIVGARLATRPQLPLRALATRLADEQKRLNELAAGDLAVRSSISLSYETLDLAGRATLRRVGYLGVPDFTPWLASWLLDCPLTMAEKVVESLVDAQLVEFVGVDQIGRLHYRLHDLVRIYARERAEVEEPAQDLKESVERVLHGWLALIERIAADYPSAEIQWCVTESAAMRVEDEIAEAVLTDPQAWFEAEQASLTAGVERGAAIGLHQAAYRFASARRSVELEGANRFDLRARIIDAVLAAVRRTSDVRGEAIMLAELGQLRYDEDRFVLARKYFSEALSRFREIGDEAGQAATLAGLGVACREPGYLAEAVHFLDKAAVILRRLGDQGGIGYVCRLTASARLERGDYPGAKSHLDESLAAYQRVGSRRGIGYSLGALGLYHRARGDYAEAVAACAESARIFGDLGDELMRSYAVRGRAKALLRMGLAGEAAPQLEWALSVAQSAGDRWGQAVTLRTLGQLHYTEGSLDLADACFDAAMRIWETLETPLWRARTQFDLALLHRAQGHDAAAEAELAAALKVFHDHGAREYTELNTLL